MHRFFLPAHALASQTVLFPEEIAHQVRSVLRLRPGQHVTGLDNLGFAYNLELVEVGQQVRAQVVDRAPADGEPALRLTLYLGLTGREKFEFVLQKATELGAAAFVPVITSRSLVQDTQDAEKKAGRWGRILQEAAEQSGRGRVPELRAPLRFPLALQAAHASHALGLIPWEGETSRSLRAALAIHPTPGAVDLFIGPEGGFSDEEMEQARAAGLLPVTLGPRILRMETAALAAVALVLYALGEME